MADYRYEKSNTLHPGITLIQDEKIPFPYGDFVNICNDALKLIDANSEFYTFASKGSTSVDDVNSLAKLCREYADQHLNLFINIKNMGGSVHIPDKEFFLKQLAQIKALSPNSSGQLEKCRSLFRVFYGTMQRCVDRNYETAKNKGIPTPNKGKIK